MKSLPPDIAAYKRTPIFTEDTLPTGLLNNHKIRSGIWGRIQVEHGELEYTIKGKDPYILTKTKTGVIEPETLHHVRPLGPVSFFIEFYK